ncbi:hypothetical protein [Brevundimonas sp. GCM10030266]|uniref:hypothetical protein n=1 Tax=Brevundimonas sp. GCM10030266 TaxID=3273386 RepID=UPI003610939A
MRLPILLTAALLMVAACDQQPASPGAEPAAPATTAATPEPVMPADAPPQEEAPAEAASCTAEQGEAAAVALASRCTRVSPASHPPCNPANPCQMIQDEIDRSCAMYGPGETKPVECAA